jgi:hypothetical protein
MGTTASTTKRPSIYLSSYSATGLTSTMKRSLVLYSNSKDPQTIKSSKADKTIK